MSERFKRNRGRDPAFYGFREERFPHADGLRRSPALLISWIERMITRSRQTGGAIDASCGIVISTATASDWLREAADFAKPIVPCTLISDENAYPKQAVTRLVAVIRSGLAALAAPSSADVHQWKTSMETAA